MTRIIIQSNGGQELEVEKATFDAGFFPDYWYVRDASGGSSPGVPGYIDADLAAAVGDPTSQTSARLRAAYVPAPTGGSDGQALVKSGTSIVWGSGGTPVTVTDNGTYATLTVG